MMLGLGRQTYSYVITKLSVSAVLKPGLLGSPHLATAVGRVYDRAAECFQMIICWAVLQRSMNGRWNLQRKRVTQLCENILFMFFSQMG